jgi:hypothetical protein
VCAHISPSPLNGPLALALAATDACSPIVSTPLLTLATNSASESSGNPVCTGFRNNVGVPVALAARASPPDTSVFPTPVFAPQTTNAPTFIATSASLANARLASIAPRAPRRQPPSVNRRAPPLALVVAVAVVHRPNARAIARVARRRISPAVPLDPSIDRSRRGGP